MSGPSVKINYCSQTDLQQLTGIGPTRASQIIEHRQKYGPFLTVEDLECVPSLTSIVVEKVIERIDWSFNGHFPVPPKILQCDARHLQGIAAKSTDIVITSPPYWKKRNYNHPQQLGQEETIDAYIGALVETINSWIPFLRPHATVFINIGDTYQDHGLVGIPERLTVALQQQNWLIVNKIIWSKNNGMPEPLPYRLASRHETVLQIARTNRFFSDVDALAQYLGQSANPGDVWHIQHSRNTSPHLAPFPEELVKRIVAFACPEHVCDACGAAFRRILGPTADLDVTRPQARRALELFREAGLTEDHLRAIRAVGISDAGKARQVQTGTNGNAKQTRELAAEAKKVLGGYFREFTFAKKRQSGWSICSCRASTSPGTVLDPFMGSGTTLKVAYQLGRAVIGADLIPPPELI
jgi:competence ComEA-like helix-hairpin-helix protein